MKKLLAALCIIAMLVTVCGCTDSTTVIEGSAYSTMEGDEIVGGTVSTGKDGNKETNKNQGGSTTGNKDNANNDDKIPTGSNSIIDDPLKVDLKGATVVIYDSVDAIKANPSLSKAEQAKAQILKKLEKELNCKLVIKTTDRDKLLSLTTAAAAGGEAIAGIITTSLYDAGKYIASNYVADVNKVSSLDLTKDYMNRSDVLNASKFGNGRYAIGVNGATFAMFYNKRILKELGYKDNYLYDMVDNGKWTYTQFRKLSKEAMKELDGKSGWSKNDQWGSVIQDMVNVTTCDILVSMGSTMVKQQNGKLKLNMTDPKITKVIELARAIYDKDGTRFIDVKGDDAVTFFNSGKALFLSAYGTKANLLNKMKDEFGVLPAPKVDGAKNYSQSVDWNHGVMLLPAGQTARNQYNAGAVMQAYMYLYEEVDEAKKKEYTNRYFCDEKSGENWLLGLKNGKAQPNQCYAKYTASLLDGTYRVFWYSIERGDSTASLIESTKVAAQKALDDLNSKIKDK